MPDNRADSLTAEGTMLPNMSIQWFPGHMAKTRRLMKESLPLVDIIIELRDARIPFSSANPEMEKMTGGKPRIILLNKSDTADESATQSWCSYLARSGVSALAVDCRSGRGLGKVVPLAKTLLREELERREQRGTAFFQPEVQQDGKRRREQRENGKIAGPAEPPACEQIDTDENDGIDPSAEQRQQDAHALLDGRDFIRPRKIRLFDPQKQGKAGREKDEKKRNKEKQQALRQGRGDNGGRTGGAEQRRNTGQQELHGEFGTQHLP